MNTGIGHRVETLGRDRIVSERLSAKAPIRHLDFSLILSALALSAIGAIAIYSATRARQVEFGLDPRHFLKRQLVHLSVAAVVFLLLLLFDYRQLRGLAPIFYGGTLLSLLLVLSPLGERVAGAQRWIDVGIFQIQPSELAKLALIVSLAALFAEEKELHAESRLPIALGMTAIPAVLIFVQPDLGTLLVLPAVLFAVLLIAGMRLRWLLVLALAGVVTFVVILNLGLIKDYQLARLTAFMDPQSDPTSAGYNLEQSKIAIGSGGFSGRGLFKGTQTNLDYVPEQHTDFIFTAIGEEKGFLGAMTVLGLFAFLFWRVSRIAMISKDSFGALLATGIGAMLAFQVFVNIGMTIGIMPITGIPLPFVSFGGSSLIVNFAAVGILMNVHMRRFV